MTPDLSSYLDRWEQAYQRGEDLTAAELCPDRPDLVESLAQGIEAIRRVRQIAVAPDLATLPPSQVDSAATVAPADPDATIPPVNANGSVGHPDSPPGYEILGELGRGGMGVVYKARQAGLGRVVALKMILSGSHAGEQEKQRFLAEAEAIARVRHAGIVQVYDFGTHENRPFFSLEFCEGGSLADLLAGTPMAPAEAARLVEQIARAVQAAHDAGVVHRDLKPANVLLVESASRGSGVQSSVGAEKQPAATAGLQPKVTDFGLAKRVEGGSGMTQTGAVMGTPSYMAPEQAEGRKDVGPAADVYALGAILYECLTGRPPFRAASAFDTLMQVVSEEPVPPRQLNAKVPVDLETITLRCLCKEPGKRYSSAGAAADDLRCFMEGRPIQARPVGRLERLWRWARREPVLASLTGAVAALLVLGSVVAWTLAGWALGEAGRAEREATEAREQKGRADNNAQLAEKREKLAEEEKKKAEKLRDRAEQLVYVGKIAQAQQAWEAGDARVAFERLDECQWNLRGWEHDQLWTQFNSNQYTFQGHTDIVFSVAWSPDGKRLASASGDKTVKVWDAGTGQQVSSLIGHAETVSSVAWSPDGKRLASASNDGTVKVWDASTGQDVYSLKGHTSTVTSVAWSPDGKRLASASFDNTLKVWDVGTGQEVSFLKGHTSIVTSVAWSPDGKRLASASFDNTVKVWDAATGQELSSLKGHTDTLECVAWSPDGKQVFGQDQSGKILAWDRTSGKLLPDTPARMPAGAGKTATSPDRRLRAFARGDTIFVERLSDAQRARDRAFLERLSRFDAAWHLAQVVEAEDAGNPFAAFFHLNRLLREQPWNAALHIRQAHALAALERPADAARHLTQALLLVPKVSLWPDDPDAGRRASQAIEAEDWPRAARTLLSMTRQSGASVQTQIDLLLACLKAGDKGGASRAAEALLRNGPRQDHLPFLLLVKLNLKDVRKLVEVTTDAALARQPSAANLGLHGMALYRAEQFEQAFKVLAEAANLDQKNPQPTVWLYQAMVARQLGRVEEARMLLAQFARSYASNPPGNWQDRAMFSLLRGETVRLLEGPPRMPRADE